MDTKETCVAKILDFFFKFSVSVIDTIRNTTRRGGGLYDHFVTEKIFSLIMIRIFIRALKFMRKVATSMIGQIANNLALISYFTTYENWM